MRLTSAVSVRMLACVVVPRDLTQALNVPGESGSAAAETTDAIATERPTSSSSSPTLRASSRSDPEEANRDSSTKARTDADAIGSPSSSARDTARQELCELFAKHNPAKLGSVDQLLDKVRNDVAHQESSP